jgi:hypothetical protein
MRQGQFSIRTRDGACPTHVDPLMNWMSVLFPGLGWKMLAPERQFLILTICATARYERSPSLRYCAYWRL